MGKTLYQKLFDSHVVCEEPGELPILYVDRHLVHEVTSPQAFEGLRQNGRKVRRTDRTFATMDHNVSTKSTSFSACSELGRIQMETLKRNCGEFNVPLFGLGSDRQGIIHCVGPEIGATIPGVTLVCGDSHTATHGAFGALAFGIGTSEVEHVLATQTVKQARLKNMKIEVNGKLQKGVYPKDVILAIIARLGTAYGTGYAVEFTGDVFRDMSMEGRMTVSNMAIEMGAKVGLIAPDETTFAYVKGRLYAPKGEKWDEAVEFWKKELHDDPDAVFDKVEVFDGSAIEPQVTWGTNPGQGGSVNQPIPAPEDFSDPVQRKSCEDALRYQDEKPHSDIKDIKVDNVFIGSCTNGRIEDLRGAAEVVKGRHVHEGVSAMVVPGSVPVRMQAEKEGLDKIFIEAGFEWRHAGCSMCLAMNDDRLPEFHVCASTSNRNFVGRQGKNGRTHLVSPAMAAAAAIAGHFVDVRKFMEDKE